MEFKKIDDRKFQCRLNEEDLEDNNISLDDFFKNDTEKIHNLLDVVMEEAQKIIGVTLSGEIMSLQLAPQPDRSILLTVSSGKDDLSNMLRKAGGSISKAFSMDIISISTSLFLCSSTIFDNISHCSLSSTGCIPPQCL